MLYFPTEVYIVMYFLVLTGLFAFLGFWLFKRKYPFMKWVSLIPLVASVTLFGCLISFQHVKPNQTLISNKEVYQHGFFHSTGSGFLLTNDNTRMELPFEIIKKDFSTMKFPFTLTYSFSGELNAQHKINLKYVENSLNEGIFLEDNKEVYSHYFNPIVEQLLYKNYLMYRQQHSVINALVLSTKETEKQFYDSFGFKVHITLDENGFYDFSQ